MSIYLKSKEEIIELLQMKEYQIDEMLDLFCQIAEILDLNIQNPENQDSILEFLESFKNEIINKNNINDTF
tara:strand:- start:491 stop:703 length:213 start_codon:yes stop_codon:yes gene_type:complete